ncbi:MAG: hypothetical protein M3Q65_07000 [Chloroflexota bacterium]|nr:hypothetical protein [Chloroflexota bacterium]
MACYDGFGNLADGRPFWIGDFNGNGRADVLFYYPGDRNWWLGSHSGPGGQLQWSFAGNTAGFGQVWDGRPFWTGNFSRADRSEVLFYFPGDRNWWLGTHDGGQLRWSFAGNTAGFGQVWDGRPFWIGDFNGNGRADVLFHYPGDRNWWLGSHGGPGGQLQWSLAGNTAGFGNVADGRPFWVGNFSRPDRREILFYYPGDRNWWLGTHDGGQLRWSLAGNTAGFGQVWDGRPFWIGDFNGNGRADVLFYYPGDGNWWLGSHGGPGGQLQWSLAGNTLGRIAGQPNFGQVWDGRPFWIGDFTGDGRSDVLFYFPGDRNWWLGSYAGLLNWSFAGNTAGFGQVWDRRPFWTGNFSRADRAEVLFYFPGDGNWWLGSHNGSQLGWSFAGNTGRPYRSRVRLHLKVLTTPNVSIDTMVESMREVYRTVGIRVDIGSTENLDLPLLNDLDVGQCVMGQTTQEQRDLFANRNNVGVNDVAVYFVRSTVPPFNGCAAHPADRPSAVVVQGATRWTLAHEIGHVLGLNHVNDNNRLMTGNGTGNITNPPPDLDSGESTTMDNSALTITC